MITRTRSDPRARISAVVVLAAALCAPVMVFGSAPASAHTLTTARPGDATIDLGDINNLPDGGSLIHATLDRPGDTLTIELAPPRDDGVRIELYLPDAKLERDAPIAARPTLRSGDGLDLDLELEDAPRRRVDGSTTIPYLRIARGKLVGSTSTGQPNRHELVITRGNAPTRVAVRVLAPGDAKAPFETSDPTVAPTSLATASAWYATPPASAPKPEIRRDAKIDVYVWLPGMIALAMVICGVWWVRRGRTRSRERGVERASAERSAQLIRKK